MSEVKDERQTLEDHQVILNSKTHLCHVENCVEKSLRQKKNVENGVARVSGTGCDTIAKSR